MEIALAIVYIGMAVLCLPMAKAGEKGTTMRKLGIVCVVMWLLSAAGNILTWYMDFVK